MKDNKEYKNKTFFHEDHARPVTRRDFLTMGIIPFSAGLLVPNIVTQILSATYARAEGACAGLHGSNHIPFLVFDLVGGAALPGNFLVGKEGGPSDLLQSYSQLGWNPKAGGAVLEHRFGLPMYSQGRILQGITQTASSQALTNLKMGSFLHFSQLDTSSNPLSALTLVSKSGVKGTLLPSGIGSVNSSSGGNSEAALKDLTLKPLHMSQAEGIAQALSYGLAFEEFSDDELKLLGRTLRNMSAGQIVKFSKLNFSDQLKAISDCAYEKNMNYGSKILELDPRQNAELRNIYNINQYTAATEIEAISAAITMNVIRGNTGPGAIAIGGCDYHDGTQNTGDTKDQEVGQQIGRAVETAYRFKKPLFFQIITDGGIYADSGTRNWRGDTTDNATIIGFFHPDYTPKQRKLQVGAFNDGQAVNQDTLLGAEPSKVAYAVLANYLSVSGRLGDFVNIAGQNFFTQKEMESILIFG